MAPARDDEFLPEVWGLYSIGTLWIVLRFAVCFRTVGLKGLGMDDGLAFIALAAWTYTCAVIHITYYIGTNTDFTAAEISVFVDHKFAEVEYGSKLFLGSWYAYIILIFSLKGIVVILYRRIFFQPWQRQVLQITTILCISGFTGITLALSLICLPFRERWQIVPRPSISCTASPKILITASCVNAVTDVLLLSIPIPILWVLNKSLRIRIGVFILLASGMFVLAACITRVSLTVVPNMSVLRIARWGVREFCIAIVAVNTAGLRPLFRKSFWKPCDSATHAHHQGNYHFPSLHRIRQHLSRMRNQNQVLNSASAGASTIDAYVREEFGSEDYVFEDPDYQVTAHPPEIQSADAPPSRTQRSGFLDSLRSGSRLGRSVSISQHSSQQPRPMSSIDKLSRQGEDADLEKGSASHSEIRRTESRVPEVRKDANLDEERVEEGHDGMARPNSG